MLGRDEVRQLLERVANIKHLGMLMLAYLVLDPKRVPPVATTSKEYK